MQQPIIDMCSAWKIHRLDIQWTVKQWHVIDVTNTSMQSNSFGLCTSRCYLVFDQFESDKNKKILKVLLYGIVEEHRTAVVKSFCIDDGKRYELKSNQNDFVTENGIKFYRHIFIVDEMFLNKNNENIDFYIKFTYFTKSNESNVSVDSYYVTEQLQKAILDDYDRMNKNEESLQQDNITFIIDNKQIQAHSLILAAASPYFSAMFRHENFKENKERTVNLTDDNDVTLENFQIFLEILYGRKSIQTMSIELVTQICVLADKYNVKVLLEPCEFILSRNLNKDNVIERLLFAEKYNFEYLKKKALDYAKTNISALKQSQNFEDLFNNKTLSLQLF